MSGSDAAGAVGRRPEPLEWSNVQRHMLEAHRLRAAWMQEAIGRALRALKASLCARVGQGHRRRMDLKILMALDERTLDDIGVRPGDLEAVQAGRMTLEDVLARRGEDVARIGPSLGRVLRSEETTRPEPDPALGRAA